MENVLYINKPTGMSSFDVCFKLRKVLGTKKIGHTGTLDPNASGVMIILYNNATKANQFLISDNKTYYTRVLFGIKTDTLDIDGNIIETSEYRLPLKEEIIDVLNNFKGNSLQQVPLTSAIKINGKRLYQYQLENKEVELPFREINVYDIYFNEMYDDGFSFTCKVSSGTYIRALVRDILNKLNIIGTVKELCRTSINDISLNDCDDLNDVLNGNYNAHDIYDILKLKYRNIEYESINDVINGKRIKLDCKDDLVLISKNNIAYAMYQKDNDEYKCIRGLL